MYNNPLCSLLCNNHFINTIILIAFGIQSCILYFLFYTLSILVYIKCQVANVHCNNNYHRVHGTVFVIRHKMTLHYSNVVIEGQLIARLRFQPENIIDISLKSSAYSDWDQLHVLSKRNLYTTIILLLMVNASWHDPFYINLTLYVLLHPLKKMMFRIWSDNHRWNISLLL